MYILQDQLKRWLKMALPTWRDLRLYLRIQTTAEDGTPNDDPAGTGNGLLAMLHREAVATVRRYLGRPIEAIDRDFVDRVEHQRAYFATTKLVVPETPIDPDSVLITDKNGNAIDSTTYTVDGIYGIIYGNEDISFGDPPYRISCSVGLETHPDFEFIEAMIGSAILDIGANLYQNRSPASTSEASGGGVSVTYGKDGVSPRTATILNGLRQIGWV